MLKPKTEISSIPEYVPGKSIDEIKEKYKLSRVIKLASNENPLGASPLAAAAYKKCAAKLHLYPRGSAPELAKKLAAKWEIKTDNLIIGNGSDEILSLAAQTYLNKGDTAAGASATFSVYASAAKMAGANYQALPLDNYRYPLSALLKNKNAKIIFVCNPNNPTGTYHANKSILAFLQKTSRNTLIILDMAYAEYTGEKEPPLRDWIKQFPNLLCARTFSKLYGLAGLRIGYGISSPEIIRALNKAKPPFNTNYPAQTAAAAALGDLSFVKKSLQMNSIERKKLLASFKNMGFEVLPSGANFICAKAGASAAEFVALLEAKGIVIRHLRSFGMPEWVRITVGTPAQNEELVQKTKLISKI